MTHKELERLGIDPDAIGEIGEYEMAIREGSWIWAKDGSAFYSEVCCEWLE